MVELPGEWRGPEFARHVGETLQDLRARIVRDRGPEVRRANYEMAEPRDEVGLGHKSEAASCIAPFSGLP